MPDLRCRFFSCGMESSSCSRWGLLPQPGMEPRPSALAWNLSHWTTRSHPPITRSAQCFFLKGRCKNTLKLPLELWLGQTRFQQQGELNPATSHNVRGTHKENFSVSWWKMPTTLKCGVRFFSWLLAFDHWGTFTQSVWTFFCHLSPLF